MLLIAAGQVDVHATDIVSYYSSLWIISIEVWQFNMVFKIDSTCLIPRLSINTNILTKMFVLMVQ